MDTDALADLLNRGYRYARALTSDPVMAEDLVQEGWSAVLAARGPHTPGYLFRAIRTRWIDGQRRQKVVQMEALDHPDLVVAPPISRPSDHAWLWQAFNSLRPAEREALFLCVIEGHTAREVAELTGRPRNTVLSLLHRGRASLRDALREDIKEVLP